MSSGSRDEALALFGAVLDFDFRLEQNLSLGDRGRVHQLFLRGAGTIVEVLVDDTAGPGITLWGLAWTSRDIEASHTRLAEAGADSVRSARATNPVRASSPFAAMRSSSRRSSSATGLTPAGCPDNAVSRRGRLP